MKIKKLIANLMAATMIMGTSLTTFAADTATITVNGLDAEATYKYLQVVEPDTTSTIGWKFVDGYADEFMTAFNVKTEKEALEALIKLGGDNNAATGTIHTSTELNKALTDLTDEVGAAGTQATVPTTVDEAGLYVIVATTTDASYSYVPMMAYIADAGSGDLQDAAVTAKGSHNTINKNLSSEGDESVSEGDIVSYEATVVYPFYTPDSADKTFWVTDTLTNGTFVADSVKVAVQEETEVPKYTTNEYADTNELKIDFSENYDSKFAGKTLVITYDAKVGAGEGDVVNDIETNLDTDGDSVTLDKVSVKVLKTGKESKPLAGATFEIYEAADENAKGYIEYKDVSVYGEENVQTLYLKALETAVTAEDGKLTFTGLDADKTYYVKETIAPSGYTVNPNYYLLTGAAKDEGQSTDDIFVYNDFDNVTVTNDNLSALPSTGGIGTTIFTIGGCVIMIAAAGLFFANRRKDNK